MFWHNESSEKSVMFFFQAKLKLSWKPSFNSMVTNHDAFQLLWEGHIIYVVFVYNVLIQWKSSLAVTYVVVFCV